MSNRSAIWKVALGLLVLTPLYGHLLLYFGNDDRGHDPVTGMIVFTAAFTVFIFVFACGGHGFYKAMNKEAAKDHRVFAGALASCIPSLLLYLGILWVLIGA